MVIKKKKSAYERLLKKTGLHITFANHLESIIETDFESQAACARKIGMAAQSLNDYTKGKRIPTPSLAGKMAHKLGYPAELFIALALSDLLKRSGYQYAVELKAIA